MFNHLYYSILCIFFTLLPSHEGFAQTVVPGSLFSSGKWVKIETSATGIHKIYYSWLKNSGFLHPENVKIYGSRNEMMSRNSNISHENSPIQLPLQRFKEVTGEESLLFFVQGPVRWVYEAATGQYHPLRNQLARGYSYFFLTEDASSDLLLPLSKQPSENTDFQSSEYDDFELWEEENLNLLESGSLWFTAMLAGGNVLSKSFTFQDRVENEPVKFNIFAAGRSTSPTQMEVIANGYGLGVVNFSPVQTSSGSDFASADSLKISRLMTGSGINLSVKYNGTGSDQCWFDYATLQLRRSLQYRGVPLLFRDGRAYGKDKIVEFQVNGANSLLQLWEVTNPLSPRQQSFQFTSGQLTFRIQNDSLRSFILFDPQNKYPEVIKTEEVKNSDLQHADTPQFLIIAPAAFLDQAERLAQYHRTMDNMTVKVVTVEDLFNGLAGGYRDVAAIRNYVRYLYQQNYGSKGSVLKYLLLFGKGTCDPVHKPGDDNPNWIPTVQSENSLNEVGSYVSDDFFGQLESSIGDPSGTINIGIGRIPASTIGEATLAVDKIIHYHEAATLGDWRNNICFIGDDEDNNLHVSDSENLALAQVQNNPEYKASKIYFDAYPEILTPEQRYPAVTDAIRRSVQSGDLIVNYVGHASEDGLAHERVLTVNDIDGWSNKDRLPLFVTATCEFSRWDMRVKRSAGEHLLFHPAGGAIALLSATRLVYSASNFEINKSFFNHVFDRDELGDHLRLGDIVRLVKNENGGSINTAKFCLLGDPALRLSYPEQRCVNLEINHQSVEQFDGILSPLSQVTISGEIRDRGGAKMGLLSGTLSVQVFDQPTTKITLGNGGQQPFTYKVQENVLFNGTAVVKNGSFSYSFVVPKDVNFNKEPGLIRYYFKNETTDGNGSFANIHFNGTATMPVSDNKGPDIRLYLENEKFSDGGTVSSNPLLLVFLSDESGINSSGYGIGHDITLELDGRNTNQLILNSYFRADAATWKSGTIIYPLSIPDNGSHTLTLRAWDNANNSSSVTVRFFISKKMVVHSVFNYPNPFPDQTRFVITQNRYDELFDVNLEVMDLTGRTVYQTRQILPSRGYEINDLYWKPQEMNPQPGFGIYIYRITLTGQDGKQVSKSGRVVWNK
ncbi:MAG: type IX secretion system sortase PorU [Bacteroidia bacterium]|nr:type IX secretion system sortase PorU [Bacteroidia bacterium]